MTYRTDKFAVGDSIEWFDDGYANMIDNLKRHGEGPFIVVAIQEPPFEDWTCYGSDSTSNWDTMGHTQHIWIESPTEGSKRFSGAFFKKVEEKTEPSADEIMAIAMGEIARRLGLAKQALECVEFDYDLRKGFISVDTMRLVSEALKTLK